MCKVTHILRASGPYIDSETLEGFDARVQAALSTALGGPLHAEAQRQASLGIAEGGLGARRAADVALPHTRSDANVKTRPM